MLPVSERHDLRSSRDHSCLTKQLSFDVSVTVLDDTNSDYSESEYQSTPAPRITRNHRTSTSTSDSRSSQSTPRVRARSRSPVSHRPVRRRRIAAEGLALRAILLERHWPDEGCSRCARLGIPCIKPSADSKGGKCRHCYERHRSCDCDWILKYDDVAALESRIVQMDLKDAELEVWGHKDVLGGPKDKCKDYSLATGFGKQRSAPNASPSVASGSRPPRRASGSSTGRASLTRLSAQIVPPSGSVSAVAPLQSQRLNIDEGANEQEQEQEQPTHADTSVEIEFAKAQLASGKELIGKSSLDYPAKRMLTMYIDSAIAVLK